MIRLNSKNIFIAALLSMLLANAPVFAQPMPKPPANPFRNLPANPDSAASNPFRDNGNSEAPPPPPPPTFDGGENYGGDAFNGGGNIGGGGESGGDNSNKPVEQLILGPKKAQNNAKSQEVVENFDYPNAEILDVAKAISKLTGRNFIYNPQEVKGRVSIVSQTPIKVEDAWKAFLTALDMKGFTIIPSGEYSRIERSQAAKEKQVPLYAGKYTPDSDEYITRVMPLKYISAKEVENTFRLWVPRQGRIYAHEQTNTLIITDTAAHIKSFGELIALLDVSGFQESLAVIPVRYAVAKDLSKIIEQIVYGTAGKSGGNSFGRPQGFTPPRPTGFGGADSSRGGSSSISQIIPDERTNSLIVKANRSGLDEIRSLVQKLDTKRGLAEGGGRIHVVRLQFADAEDVSKALGGIVQSKGASSNRLGTFPPLPGQSADPVATLFQGEIKVSPDVTTQSLVITASPQDFLTLKKVIEQLDIPRDQVFVEAVIMELNVSNSTGFGVSLLAPSSGIAFPSNNLTSLLSGNPNNGLNLGFKSGNPVSVPGPNGTTLQLSSLQGMLELLQSTGNSTIVARPHLTALDNQDAEVEVSEEIPVPQSTQNTISTTTSYSKDKASLKLKVKPHINKASDFVRMEIEQALEEFDSTIVPKDVQGKANGKNIRSTKTQVVVQNEDTVVLSGLIRDRKQETTNKVPILGDIPVLGWLFKNQAVVRRKTDLVVFITPRIVKQYEKVRAVLSDRVQERSDFVKDNLGGEDPQGPQMRRLKAKLPELSTLQPLAPANSATSDSASFSAPTRGGDDDANSPAQFNNMPPMPMADPGASPIWNDSPPPPPPGDFGGDGGGERF